MDVRTTNLVQAAMRDRETDEVVALCGGADEYGKCPRVVVGDVVPCAGTVLLAEAPSVGWQVRLEVGDFARRCPLRAFVPSDL
jgi:hypothetical protein